MFIIQYIAKLIKIIRSAASPGQIAGGFILGMILGLTPFWSLHNLVVFFLIVMLNVNIAMAIFSFGIFSGLAYLIDPLFHSFGFYLLADVAGLRPLWTAMYNMPVIALSRFNNTVVMGSLVSSLILLIPVHFTVKKLIILYREKLETKVQKLKVMQMIKASKIYSLYEKLKFLGD